MTRSAWRTAEGEAVFSAFRRSCILWGPVRGVARSRFRFAFHAKKTDLRGGRCCGSCAPALCKRLRWAYVLYGFFLSCAEGGDVWWCTSALSLPHRLCILQRIGFHCAHLEG